MSAAVAAEALKNEGNARKSAGDLQGAVASYRRALEVAPRYVPALYNLGLALRELGDMAQAESSFRRVLEIDPRDADALFNLGALLRRRLSFAEAQEMYRRAIELDPKNPHLHLMFGELGVACYTDESLLEAARSLQTAIELRPEIADAHYYLGQVHELEGRHAESLPAYSAALRLAPDDVRYRTAVLAAKQRLCDWDGIEALWTLTRRAVGASEQLVEPFTLLSMPSTPDEQLHCARLYGLSVAARVDAERRRLDFRFDRPVRPRRRIGYLSAEFHAHATAYLAAELFELHDRARFEVFAYSYGPDDGSPIRARLKRAFDRFVDVRSLTDSEAASAIHADGIEVLVDLKGYTFRARPDIVALRPAPVQVSYLGYPGTMGASFIDHLVGDRIVTPPEDAVHYSEQLALIPGSYQVNDRQRAVGPTPSRRALGLPERAFVFCCFNQAYKILPEVFSVWTRLLKAVPGSVLWLLEWNPSIPENLRREASRHGVEPERLVFSPFLPVDQHLARMRNADLFLDTLPYNAHTTASEALWVGLPVLTCAGDTFASRVAASLLDAAGLPELVTHSLAQYEALALRLATQPQQLASMRDKLERARGTCALFDSPRFVRNLERAYEAMWSQRALT